KQQQQKYPKRDWWNFERKKKQETYEANPLGESLKTVLSQKSNFLLAFRDFLKLEFCEENLEFWLACREYRSFDSLEERTQIAASIYEEFIREGSPKQVNLDSYTRETIRQSLEEPGSSCFAVAERKIFTLMENCSFPRFTETEPYKLFINSLSKQREGWSHQDLLRLSHTKPATKGE
uniref:RGS domain-containing protein n=1 Tax=Xiphophorus couchianus TaxID=32473 RepID=A0A3B5LGF7_9TELE